MRPIIVISAVLIVLYVIGSTINSSDKTNTTTSTMTTTSAPSATTAQSRIGKIYTLGDSIFLARSPYEWDSIIECAGLASFASCISRKEYKVGFVGKGQQYKVLEGPVVYRGVEYYRIGIIGDTYRGYRAWSPALVLKSVSAGW